MFFELSLILAGLFLLFPLGLLVFLFVRLSLRAVKERRVVFLAITAIANPFKSRPQAAMKPR